jgi:putative holliday junction resolvase
VGRILGLDPGTRRHGVAVSDSAWTMAFPRPALDAEGDWLTQLARIIDDEGVTGIVAGRPLGLSGATTASTEKADDVFRQILDRFPDLPAEQWDERLTTVEASRSLRDAGRTTRDQRDAIDSAAATVLLQSYMEAKR